MKKKLFTCLVAGTMAVSLAACGGGTSGSVPESSELEPAPVPSSSEEPAYVAPTPVALERKSDLSIDFEDGNFAFVEPYTQKANAADITLSVEDYEGSKALKVVNNDGNCPYVGLDVSSLLGADVAKLATIEFLAGTEHASGFAATSGKIYSWSGEDLDESSAAWSVYTEGKNPYYCSRTLDDGQEFIADAGNLFILSLETDNGTEPATWYIDDIRFLDKDGNLLKPADTTVAFNAPAAFKGATGGFQNLFALAKSVAFPDFACKGGAWAQDGFSIPDDVRAAIVPGSVIQVDYTSTTGHMWVLFPDSAAGWMRVGVGDYDGSGQGYAYTNNAGTSVQISYDDIVKVVGDDPAAWGDRLQCESDGDWEVYGVKVGQAAPVYAPSDTVAIDGAAFKGSAWGQEGVSMTDDFRAALVPGSVIEIDYTSATGELWTVFPDSAAGWMRVGVGDYDGSGQGYALCDGSKCFIPYETIAQYLGDDTSAWGDRIQCEASSDWEVYGIKVGKATGFKPSNSIVALDGAAFKGGAWGQEGVSMTDDFRAALVPGSVINIDYTSATGELWTVFPDSAAGWMRVGVGNYDGSGQGNASCDGTHCQITYETIAAYLGEDTSTWGDRIQCEATSDWEVYGISVGQVK